MNNMACITGSSKAALGCAEGDEEIWATMAVPDHAPDFQSSAPAIAQHCCIRALPDTVAMRTHNSADTKLDELLDNLRESNRYAMTSYASLRPILKTA